MAMGGGVALWPQVGDAVATTPIDEMAARTVTSIGSARP
jgi:hypothetical protein